jgi:hypothetical protein
VNNLSLLIYLAGVTGNLSNFLTFVTVVFGILGVICVIVWLVSLDTSNFSSSSYAEHVKKHSWRWSWAFLSLMIFTGSVSALTPTRQTVLLIAGSEMGERVLNHPKFNQVVDPGLELVTTWMQKETAEIRRSMDPTKKQ